MNFHLNSSIVTLFVTVFFMAACSDGSNSGGDELKVGGKLPKGRAQTTIAQRFSCDPAAVQNRENTQFCAGQTAAVANDPQTQAGLPAHVWIILGTNPWGKSTSNLSGKSYAACVNVINGDSKARWYTFDNRGEPKSEGKVEGGCQCWLEGAGAAAAATMTRDQIAGELCGRTAPSAPAPGVY